MKIENIVREPNDRLVLAAALEVVAEVPACERCAVAGTFVSYPVAISADGDDEVFDDEVEKPRYACDEHQGVLRLDEPTPYAHALRRLAFARAVGDAARPYLGFLYPDARDVRVRRFVVPQRVYAQDGTWFVVAHDLLTDAQATFECDRAFDIAPVERKPGWPRVRPEAA